MPEKTLPEQTQAARRSASMPNPFPSERRKRKRSPMSGRDWLYGPRASKVTATHPEAAMRDPQERYGPHSFSFESGRSPTPLMKTTTGRVDPFLKSGG